MAGDPHDDGPHDDGPHDDGPHDDDQRRTLTNAAVLAVAALLVLAGLWLMDAMVRQSRLEDCLLAHRRNCVPVEKPADPG
jgi:hypothetical protein